VTSSIVPRKSATSVGVRKATRSHVWLLEQLPNGLLDSDFFVRFVSIFQDLAETLVANADNVENLLDVNVAPPEMVRWLGSWIGIAGIDGSLPDQLQRRIVESSADTLVWRGTARGLQRYLEIISGGPAIVEDSGGVFRDGEAPIGDAWVKMRVESTGWLATADFATIVRDEVPAHVRAELWVADRLIWTSDEGVQDVR
jgi:phage tail-like protein